MKGLLFNLVSSKYEKKSVVLVTAFIVGLIILLLPDKDISAIRLNKTHAPSFIDLIGLLLMLTSWFASCVIIISRWKRIKEKTGNRTTHLLLLLYFVFLSGIIAGLIANVEWMLWFCAIGASAINIFFIIFAFSSKK